MIGLRYIRKLYSMSMQDLANKLGITRSTVYQWENKKIGISDESLEKISKLFNMDKKYFTKDLDKTDELNIQRRKIENEIKDSTEEILFKETDRHTGNQCFRYEKMYDTDLMSKREDINNEISKVKLIELIKKTLDFDNDGLKLYQQFQNIFDSCENKAILKYIFRALEVYYCGGFDTDDNVTLFLNLIKELDKKK